MNQNVKQAIVEPVILHRITEVLIPSGQNSNAIVIPLVASLSGKQESGWLTWITHRRPSKEQLVLLGAKEKNLRIVHIKSDTDARWMIWEALAKGNSHTVICDVEAMDTEDINAFEQAATQGDCVGITIRTAE